MKRVLLLVFLMVSLVELDLERYRIYLFCSAAAFASLFCNVLMSRRRKAQKAPAAHSLESVDGDSCLSTEESEVDYVSPSSSSEHCGENVGSAQHYARDRTDAQRFDLTLGIVHEEREHSAAVSH
jgi:hypothetical protein